MHNHFLETTGMVIKDPSRMANITWRDAKSLYKDRQQRVLTIHDRVLNSSFADEQIVKIIRLTYSGLDEDLTLAEEILNIWMKN